MTTPTAPGRGGPSGPRLLVAEDNAVNQQLAVAMLAKLGYEADVVANGVEALEALSRVSYAAVLMDCQMPEMDGYEAAAEIRRRERGERHLPIIAMTAAAMAADQERCFAAGMDDYVAKPVGLEHLASVLRRWTEGSADAPGGEEPTESPSDALLDTEQIAELRSLSGPSDGGNRMANLVSSFLDSASGRLSDIRGAAAARDGDAVARLAHSLAGGSGMLGARVVYQLARELEATARTNPASIQEIVDRLEVAIDEVSPLLRSAFAPER